MQLNTTVELVPVESLIPYARNARTHSDAQVAQIAASIKEFGFTNPILIDGEGGIIAGHGRLLAARKLALPEVPCIRLGYLSKTQRQALVLADNQLALNAGWDEELLRVELEDLELGGFDLDLLGFELDVLPGYSSASAQHSEDEEAPAASINTQDEPASNDQPDSSAREIDPDDFEMSHRCPRCGFEFDEKA